MPQDRLAVLIDADNAQADLIEPLLAEVAKHGVASVKRIYGNWTTSQLGSWKQKLLEHAIQPIQQFNYTDGKNATDSALIIDAMDLLYTGKLNGFCLVSSDSDFTRLATRLRESGLMVYGFGRQTTPRSLIAACNKFTFVEILRPVESQSVPLPAVPESSSKMDAPATEVLPAASSPADAKTQIDKHVVERHVAPEAQTSKTPKSTAALKQDTKLVNLLRGAIAASCDDAGWAHLGPIGSHIAKQAPEFDARNYGYERLGELIKAIDLFEIDERQFEDRKLKAIFVRDSRQAKKAKH